MNVNIVTLAEVVGIAAVVVGSWMVANLGGLVLGIGAVLLYEARS